MVEMDNQHTQQQVVFQINTAAAATQDEQLIQGQQNEDMMDIEELRMRCKRLKQENQEMQLKLQVKDQELQLQKQSLSNLAVTVVNQDKHIKQLTSHLEDVYKTDGSRRQDSQTDYSGSQSIEELQEDDYHEMNLGINLRGELQEYEDDIRASPLGTNMRRRSRASTPQSQKSSGSNGKGGSSRHSPQPVGSSSPQPPRIFSQHFRKKSMADNEGLLIEDFDNMHLGRSQSGHVRHKHRRSSRRDSSPILDEIQPRRLQRQSSEQVYSHGSMTYRGHERMHTPPMDGHMTSRRLQRTRTSPIRGLYEGAETHREMRNEFRRSTGSHHGHSSRDFGMDGRAYYEDSVYGYDRYEHRSSRQRRLSNERRGRYGFQDDIDDDFDLQLLKDKIDALENDQLQGGWPLESDEFYEE